MKLLAGRGKGDGGRRGRKGGGRDWREELTSGYVDRGGGGYFLEVIPNYCTIPN